MVYELIIAVDLDITRTMLQRFQKVQEEDKLSLC